MTLAPSPTDREQPDAGPQLRPAQTGAPAPNADVGVDAGVHHYDPFGLDRVVLES